LAGPERLGTKRSFPPARTRRGLHVQRIEAYFRAAPGAGASPERPPRDHEVLASRPSRERDLCEAMIVARVLGPVSKFATAQALQAETTESSLGLSLSLERVDEDDLYEAMDWLLKQQVPLEQALA